MKELNAFETYKNGDLLKTTLQLFSAQRISSLNSAGKNFADFNRSKPEIIEQRLISSPEPSGSQGELIVYPCSGVRPSSVRRPSTISNIFSSETTWPIKAKFYVEPPWEGGTKVCINGPGHMTKMAAMPIYGKNLKKSSSPEPAGRFPRNLVCSIGDSCPS